MINVENIIFSRVADKFSASYPNGSRYGEPMDSPARFPCLTIWESDNSTYEKSLDAEMTEHHANLTYDVNIYSNLISGAKAECKAIMEIVDKEMLSMGFTRMFCNPTKNQDTRIFRLTARYRGVISEDFKIYRR